jgi:hypothetical protein
MFVAEALKTTIDALYWLSPYRWLDERLKSRQQSAGSDDAAAAIEQRRYRFSELYICGWFVASLVCVAFSAQLPQFVIVIFALRILGMVNKEAGVVLFGICKISPDRTLSNPGRVIPLALCNYFTAGMLFSVLYTKIGTYAVGSSQSALDIKHALVQAMSLHFFMLGPAFSANDDLTGWSLIIAQGIFCFLFGTMIVTVFIATLQFKSREEKK